MEKVNYLLVRDTKTKKVIDIDYNKIDGFKVKPLNNIEYDGVLVNRMVITNPSFIEKVLRRKIKIKLDLFLKFIISLIDADGDTDITSLRNALNDLSKYRTVVINNYQKFLDQKYVELLLKKISLLENELKMKIIYYKEPEIEKEEENRKSR